MQKTSTSTSTSTSSPTLTVTKLSLFGCNIPVRQSASSCHCLARSDSNNCIGRFSPGSSCCGKKWAACACARRHDVRRSGPPSSIPAAPVCLPLAPSPQRDCQRDFSHNLENALGCTPVCSPLKPLPFRPSFSRLCASRSSIFVESRRNLRTEPLPKRAFFLGWPGPILVPSHQQLLCHRHHLFSAYFHLATRPIPLKISSYFDPVHPP